MIERRAVRSLGGLAVGLVMSLAMAGAVFADQQGVDNDLASSGNQNISAQGMFGGAATITDSATIVVAYSGNNHVPVGTVVTFTLDTHQSIVTETVSGAVTHLPASAATSVTLTVPADWGPGSLVSGVSAISFAAPAASGSYRADLKWSPSASPAIDRNDLTGAPAYTITFAVDATPPTLSLPGTTTAEATGPSGATVTYAATATDLVDGPTSVTCSPASGSTFPVGTTTVSCSSTDAHGNTANGSFTVTITDTTPPALTLPASITAEATGASGAAATYSASATDLVDGSTAVTCSAASGSTFALGTTTVTCSSTDAHGNTSSGSFTVTVRDTTAPALTVPADITTMATGPSGAAVSYSAGATDLVDGAIAPTCAPASGSTFGLGSTTVTCSATDAHGNTATKTFSVTVKTWAEAANCFLAPLTRNATTAFKAGGAIPVKCSVPFANATTPAPRISVTSSSGSVIVADSGNANGGGTFMRYDGSLPGYIYNWNTAKTLKGTFTITITFVDGSTAVRAFVSIQ